MKIWFHSTVGCDYDLELLPFFVKHYLNLGIDPENFLLILNSVSCNSDNIKQGAEILNNFNIKNYEAWEGEWSADKDCEKKLELFFRSKNADKIDEEDWIVNADVDEFHEYPDELHSFLESCDNKGVNVIQSSLIDRIAPSLRLHEIDTSSDGVLSQVPLKCDVVGGIKGGNWKKVMAYKREHTSRGGNHNVFAGRKYNDRSKRAYYYYKRDLSQTHLTFERRLALDVKVNHVWFLLCLKKLRDRVSSYKKLAESDNSARCWINHERFLNHYDKHGFFNIRTYK